MDGAMTTNVWNYTQPLYQRYCYDRQPASHYYPHCHETSDAMTPIFKSSQSYCSLNYAAQPPSVAADSVPGAWKVLWDATAGDRPWPAAVKGHALGRPTDAAAAVAAAAQHGWTPYPGIGT